jgi:hypothetical protein
MRMARLASDDGRNADAPAVPQKERRRVFMGLPMDREPRRVRFPAVFVAAAVALLPVACGPHTLTGPGEPEGAQLLFSTFDPQTGSWGVATAGQDGRGEREVPLIVANPGDYPDIAFHNVQWSPDGRRIAYRASNTNTDNWYLVLSDARGSFKRTLTPLGGYTDNARWSPRGDRLLYDWGGFVGGRGGQSIQTALVDTLGNRTDFFIEGDGDVFEGERVYFGLLPWADSSGAVPALYDAAWAADGEHLVVVGTIGRRAWDPGLQAADVELFRVSVATRRVIERITHNDVPEWGFRLAPDERHMLLTVWHESSSWHPIEGEYFMPTLGQATDLIRLFAPPNALDAGRWSTDSRHITYTRPTGSGGYPAIFIHDVQTRMNLPTTASGFRPHLHVPQPWRRRAFSVTRSAALGYRRVGAHRRQAGARLREHPRRASPRRQPLLVDQLQHAADRALVVHQPVVRDEAGRCGPAAVR